MKKLLIFAASLLAINSFANDDVFQVRKLDNEKLMNIYWKCDDLSKMSVKNNTSMDMHSMAICGAVSTEVVARKFNGDFKKYHEWFKSEKHKK